MKNVRFERNRRLQKEYGRRPNQHLENGIVVRHLSPESPDPTIKTWWDDTGFNLNGVRISIWWTHPRMGFNDAIEEIAYDNVPYPKVLHDYADMFSDSKKIYKKVGKSGNRKKIIGYETVPKEERDKVRHEWYDKLKAEEERLKKETDLVIKPSYKVESFDWCRGVSICVPMEVRGVPDLKKVCELVKGLLKGTKTLATEFPDYTYTKDDWAKENAEVPMNGMFCHAVKC